jgi:hypothetical protein
MTMAIMKCEGFFHRMVFQSIRMLKKSASGVLTSKASST